MKVVILVNGDIVSSCKIKKHIDDADMLIAADGGANIAYREGYIPKYIIGDLDSIDNSVLDYFKLKGSIIEKYPCDKDYVDTELCLNKALEFKATEIVYLGGIGNRLDHNIGNIHLLYKTIQKGIRSYIVSETADVYICSDCLSISGKVGDTVSILPLLENTKGITLKGFKYTLNKASFDFGNVFGTCNVMKEEKCYIEIDKGALIVIKQYNI